MYLSADGGGSKLRLLLLDDNLSLIDSVESTGVNTNFIPIESVKRTICEAVERCIPKGAELRCVSVVMLSLPEFFIEAVRDRAQVRQYHKLREGEAGLMAGTGQARGFAALSGTGSDVFFCSDGAYDAVGGWGMLLGDEGSGYEIGQKGLRAAIHSYDGRAGASLLLDLLIDRWGFHEDTLFQGLCARVYGSAAARGEIAAFAPLVGEAARQGDRAAIAIYRQAGLDLALQMNTLIGRVRGQVSDISQVPVTLCGGAWKGSFHMFDAFRSAVLAKNPGMQIHWPLFDAVISGVMDCAQSSGMDTAEVIERLRHTCQAFIYQKPDDWSEPI